MHWAKTLGRNALVVLACSVAALVVLQPARWVAAQSGWPVATIGTCLLLVLGATAFDYWRWCRKPHEEKPQAPQMPAGTTVLLVYQRPWWPVIVLAFIGSISFGFALGAKSSPTIINYVPNSPEAADSAGGEAAQ